MPNPLNVPITPPRVAFIDPRTGTVSREWYMFFLSLYQLTGGSNVSLDDLQKGPPALTIDEVNNLVERVNVNIGPSQDGLLALIAELQKQVNSLEMAPRSELGTMAALQQANLPWVTFDTTAEGVPPDIGTVAWDGGTTLGIQMTANVLQRVGESEYVYAKASSAITKGQLCYHTGSVGSSGVITVAPTPLNLADPNQIVGVAAETIALNGFGLIQISGDLRGFNTTGSSVGETWADGDPLYYNPAYVGSMTKVKPSAPNQKTYIGEVINAGNAGSGSMHIRIVPGSILGGTDSNVQFGTLADKDFIQYDSALQYWKNIPPSALTKTDDTNVTLTLGGSPTQALLAATSLTLGWTGQLSVARGGSGASTAAGARTNFGATTVGSNLFTLTNPSAITFMRINADNTVSTLDAATFRTAIGAGTGGGTVTSVAASGGTTGLTFSGSPITSSGTLTLAGTLGVANGGTGLTSVTANRIPYGNGTSALQTSANLTFDGTNLKIGSKTTPTVTGGQAALVGDCLIFAGDTVIGSPYTQNLQIEITWTNWGANPAIALVEVAIAAREFAGTAGAAFGWLYATNGGGATFNSFVTTGVTTTQGTLTAASGGNYILRLTFDPTSQTDRIGYTIRIPTMSGGTGTSVTSIVASLV